MKTKLIAKVNKMPGDHEFIINRFVVATVSGMELWYYGAYRTRKRAEEVAYGINNGIVLEVEVEE